MIRIDGLSRVAGSKTILESINLEINRGEIFTLIGPSGSGKTTLMRLIDLLDTPTYGTMIFNGPDTAKMKRTDFRSTGVWAWSSRNPPSFNTTVAGERCIRAEFQGGRKLRD